MIEVADTFVFACPHCYVWQEMPRSQLRTWSFCRHCQEPIFLLDANQSLRDDETLSAVLQERLRAARSSRRSKALVHKILDVPLGVILLPFHLAWLILFLGSRLTSRLLNRSKSRYEQQGWRGFTQFRLSHFLIAVTALAVAMAYYGPRYARQWKLQKEAQAFYESKLALAEERESLQRTVARLGGNVLWNSGEIPSTYHQALRKRDWRVLQTKASVSYFASRPVPPSQLEWQSTLTEICRYPELVQLSLYSTSTSINGAVFEALPASESLQDLTIPGESFPLEGYRWIARCPNLVSLTVSVYGRPKDEGAEDARLEAVSHSPSLESLSISFTGTSADGLAALSNLETLRVLHLTTRHPFDSDAIAQLASLPLEEMSLTGQSLSDEAVAKLCEGANMHTLYLGSGTVTESQFQQLQNELTGKGINLRSSGNVSSGPNFAPR